jgi:hypothetical protein
MADVFISYKSEDRQIAGAIAAEINRRGLTSWWDDKLEAGIDADYEQTIRRELNFARCVLVVWTVRSVESIWVKAEANHGLLRAAVLSVIIDGVDPPLPFNMVERSELRTGELFRADIEAVVDEVEVVLRKKAPGITIEKPVQRKIRPTTIEAGGGVSRRLDVAKDITDRRDRQFQGLSMAALPDEFPSQDERKLLLLSHFVKSIVQDQCSTAGGAAYGLATVANLMELRKNGFRPLGKSLVSTSMLFHFACLQEGRSADDRGVSCRSALAGWLKNGLCRAVDWPLETEGGSASTPDVWRPAALQRPLAGYYRIPTHAIYDIQTALLNFGVVYASVLVHKGWLDVKRRQSRQKLIPRIPWSSRHKALGGHAMAIVGYTKNGFVVMNSWGLHWGYDGLAILTYDDWLANGMDVWCTSQATPINLKTRVMNI